MLDHVGEQLGNYRLIRLLGRGAFAEVYLGEHVHLGTKAAIKVLHTDVAGEDFLEEARLLANLKHPHIVRILEFDLDGQTPYLVMDYAPKGNLRVRHSKGTRLSITIVVDYVKQVAEALQYAHDRKIVHRDIKPENMLIGEHDEILLSDFGIAITSQSSRYQSTPNVAGTVVYMAPEQIDGHACRASDQYALGVVVYEWLCGTPPFQGSLTEMAIMHTAALPPPLRSHLPELSSNVEYVVFRALKKDPKERFASVQDFAIALEQASQDMVPTVRRPPKRLPPPPPLPQSPLSFIQKRLIQQRSRWVYIALASIILATLVLGYILISRPVQSSPAPFSTLCSGNAQSTSSTVVPRPAISTPSDGEPIGLSEGATIFDLQRPNQDAPEVQDKLQAAQDIANNPQDVEPSLNNALSIDPTDAEAQIYLENWKVLESNHPHITIVIGVSFLSDSAQGSRGTLQGAYTAQKECNEHSQGDGKTQVVLMLANISGNNDDERATSARFVATQIADQAHKDTTIVGIVGWPTSAESINVTAQLKTRSSLLPMVSTSASSDGLGGMYNFFRICPINKDQAQVAADLLLKTKQKKKIAILYDSKTAFSNNLKDDFAGDIPNNKTSGQPVGYTGGDQMELQTALNTVLAQKPDAIFFSGYLSDLVVLLNDISATPYANLPIVGEDGLASTNDYPSSIPSGMDHVYFTAFASPKAWDNANPQPSFFQEYKANFGTTTAPTGLPSIDADVMLSYDAMSTLLYSSQQVFFTKNTITPSDLDVALKQITATNAIQGITGRIAFDRNGDQDPSKAIFVEHVQGTNLVIDETHGCLLKDGCGL